MIRKQFTFYRSIYDSAQQIPDPLERLRLYEAVIRFALEEKEPEGLSPWALSLFISIRPNLEASAKKSKAGMASAKKRYGNEKEKEKEVEKELEKEKELELEIEDECLAGAGFENFWKSYPLKVGKQKALEAWKNFVKDPRSVMEGLVKWKGSAQWNRENGRFIPRAARFLEDGDYKADPPGYVPTGGTGKLGQAELDAIASIMARED